MAFPVRAVSGGAYTDGHFLAVIVVEGLTLKNVIGLSIAMVLMETDGASRWNGNLGEHVVATQLLFSQELFNGDGTLAASLVLSLYNVAC